MSRGAFMGMVVLLVAAAGVIWWRQTHRPSPVPPATAPPPVAPPRAPPPPPAPAIQNPVPAAAAPDGLPSLDQSDGYVKKAWSIWWGGSRSLRSFDSTASSAASLPP